MRLTRRGLLAAGAAAALPLPSLAAGLVPRRGRLRVAHLTDFHAQPEKRAPEGIAACLQHAVAQRPDLLLLGGDLIMDAWHADEARTALQWEIFQDLLAKHVPKGIPVHSAIGNHDLWGVDKKGSGTTGAERRWGTAWFRSIFGYEKTYHAFDLGKWRFVVLDNVLVTPDGYNGVVPDEQVEWLEREALTPERPTLLLSHIPILSITPAVVGYSKERGEWNVGGSLMTKNEGRLREVFAARPWVKGALSGHLHMVDRLDYAGVSYLCGGAVCGNWWNGIREGFPPGYRLLDLHDDGRIEDRYVPWGWRPA